MRGLYEIARRAEQMSNGRVRNYATPGLTSYLVGGGGRGVVRLFEADRDTREWITPHSHRFDFTCLVLAGTVENILFVPGIGENLNRYAKATLRPVSGGLGRYELVRDGGVGSYGETASVFRPGDVYEMAADQIHSIRFSRHARVLFFEGPPVSDTSVVLEPYSDGRIVETFHAHPWMFDRAPDGSTPNENDPPKDGRR